MALVKSNGRSKWWVPAEDPGSEYRPPAAVAHRMIAKGYLEEIIDEEGGYTGRYRLTEAGFRKARGVIHAV
jgi:hypothetical protein